MCFGDFLGKRTLCDVYHKVRAFINIHSGHVCHFLCIILITKRYAKKKYKFEGVYRISPSMIKLSRVSGLICGGRSKK